MLLTNNTKTNADNVQRRYDASYILNSIILPALGVLFLALELASVLHETADLTGCSRLAIDNNPFLNGGSQQEKDMTFLDFCLSNSANSSVGAPVCLFRNKALGLENGTYPLQAVANPAEVTSDQSTSFPESGALAVGIVGTSIVVICCIGLFATQRPVLVLVSSVATLLMEVIVIFALVVNYTRNVAAGQFWTRQLLYLQLAVLFSTLFGFVLNLVGQGDAKVLREDLGMENSAKRKCLLIGIQACYAFALAINFAAFAIQLRLF